MLASLMLLAAQGMAVAPSPAEAAVQQPSAWWVAVVRQDSARAIADDLPSAPRLFRFQCRVAEFTRKPWHYVSSSCVPIETGPIVKPKEFEKRLAEQGQQPVATAEDRLRRAAWLRVMLFYAEPETDTKDGRYFLIEESVGAGDLKPLPAPAGLVASPDIVFDTPPQPEYSQAALRDGAQGRIPLTCRVTRQVPDCRTADPLPAIEPMNFDGNLAPRARSYFLLLHDAHAAMQGARVAQTTRDGRPTEGTDISKAFNFSLP